MLAEQFDSYPHQSDLRTRQNIYDQITSWLASYEVLIGQRTDDPGLQTRLHNARQMQSTLLKHYQMTVVIESIENKRGFMAGWGSRYPQHVSMRVIARNRSDTRKFQPTDDVEKMADDDMSERRLRRRDHGIEWRNPEQILLGVTRFDHFNLSLIDDRQRETIYTPDHVIGDTDTYNPEPIIMKHEGFDIAIRITYLRHGSDESQ